MSSFIPSYCWDAPQSVCPPLQQTLRVTVTAASPARWPLPAPLHEPTLPRVPETGSQNFPVCLDDSVDSCCPSLSLIEPSFHSQGCPGLDNQF